MKLLFDQNISFRVLKKLNSDFLEAVHVADVGLNNVNDIDIWKFAKQNQYTIVTFDADFLDISVIKGHPPKIIWIRLSNPTTDSLAEVLNKKQAMIALFLQGEDYREVACLEVE